MIEQRFGESPPWSVGAEEEVMILDAATLAPAPRVGDLVAGSKDLDLPGQMTTELHASVVELKTAVCASVGEALAALRELRGRAIEIADGHGLAVAAAGTHPLADPESLDVVDKARYRGFVGYAGVSARRQGVSGLHVHVGMPSADACFAVMEHVLPWLPLVLALSANSPYVAGRETGLMSNRAEMLAQLPRSGAPPAFGSYSGWERFVERFARSGVPLGSDYTSFWWDVRPHPRFGTLEVRMPDQPTALERTAAFIALLQAVCADAHERGSNVGDAAGRGIYQQNRWAASRFGTKARLIHPDRDETVAVPALAHELLARVRPVAEQLGGGTLLDSLDPAKCEGDRQLAVGRERGLHAVVRDLVERSIPSP